MLALQALGVGPGDEVILPPFTFFATAGSVCRLGATPVFADIDPETFNLDPLRVEAKITRHTKAIMAVHLFGQCADMDDLSDIAECHGLPIIEDAAQAIGSDFKGKRTGNLGAIGCFSFYPSKTLGAYGDGGLAVTNNADWAKRMACLRVHGMEPRYYHQMIGWNARLDEVQSAILRVKLPHLESWIAGRQQAAKRYDALIAASGLGEFPRTADRPQRSTAHLQPVCGPRGARPARRTRRPPQGRHRIGCEIYYPVPLHLQPCLDLLGYRKGDFPISEEATAAACSPCRCSRS